MPRKPRPTVDPSARRLNVQLAPPADLAPDKLKLWHHQFDRFPPGYFVPSDLPGMLLYLDAHAIYAHALAELTEAEKFGIDKPLKEARKECRDAMHLLHRLQRDLRMFPSTRTHREIHGSLANNPTAQAAQPGDEKGWRNLFPVSASK